MHEARACEDDYKQYKASLESVDAPPGSCNSSQSGVLQGKFYSWAIIIFGSAPHSQRNHSNTKHPPTKGTLERVSDSRLHLLAGQASEDTHQNAELYTSSHWRQTVKDSGTKTDPIQSDWTAVPTLFCRPSYPDALKRVRRRSAVSETQRAKTIHKQSLRARSSSFLGYARTSIPIGPP